MHKTVFLFICCLSLQLNASERSTISASQSQKKPIATAFFGSCAQAAGQPSTANTQFGYHPIYAFQKESGEILFTTKARTQRMRLRKNISDDLITPKHTENVRRLLAKVKKQAIELKLLEYQTKIQDDIIAKQKMIIGSLHQTIKFLQQDEKELTKPLITRQKSDEQSGDQGQKAESLQNYFVSL